jgi:hypothetical protein
LNGRTLRIAPGNAAFTRYWVAETLLALGQEIFLVAVGWQIYALTDSAMSLGFIGLAQFLPLFLLALPAGHVADNFDRRQISLLCQLTKFAAVAWIAVGSYQGAVSVATFYACTVAFGVAHAFQQPALRALIPTLVTRNELPQCIAWTFGAKKAAIIAGPALGGLIYLISPVAAYGAAAVCFLGAGFLLARMKLTQASMPTREPMTLKSLFGGIAFISKRPVIFGAMSLDLFAVLFGGATALLPIYARDILNVGPGGLGSAARCARRRRVVGLTRAGTRQNRPAYRPHTVRFDRGVRRCDYRVRPVALVRAVDRRTHRARRLGHGEHGDPSVAHTVADARRNARPRRLGRVDIYRHLEPARTVRVRPCSRMARHRCVRRHRRRGHAARRGIVDLLVSGVVEG